MLNTEQIKLTLSDRRHSEYLMEKITASLEDKELPKKRIWGDYTSNSVICVERVGERRITLSNKEYKRCSFFLQILYS